MRILRTLSLTLLSLMLSAAAFSQPLPLAKHPEDVGISSERVARLHKQLQADVDSSRVPGTVMLVVRNGKIAIYEAVGFQDRKAQKPMQKDSIFRIASMSKPITSVAIMMLSEEGKVDIGAPVAQYLPEFKDVKVGVEKAAPKRPMTVQDLLRHTSGLTYGVFGNSAVDQLYRAAPVFTAPSLADMIKTVAGLPLLHQPGEAWEYSVSADVLGRIVEVTSGKSFDTFIAERITGPLKMPDTGFFISTVQAARFAKPDVPNPLLNGDPTVKPAILSGGGGLLSTAGDYARFCQMMLNGGELDGVRLLSPKTVALMTSDQLPATTERHTPVAMGLNAFGPTPEMGTSFGLGFAVRVDPGRNPVPGSVGDFSWSGVTGTFFWVDPKEKLVAVMMVQTPQGINVPNYRQARTMVYQALTN
jgi:CubicO group peptidase (beta-lactamase class C family)